jgi:hypothetical protein
MLGQVFCHTVYNGASITAPSVTENAQNCLNAFLNGLKKVIIKQLCSKPHCELQGVIQFRPPTHWDLKEMFLQCGM